MLDSGTNIIVWHKDLKPNPAENADVVLAYHNRGLRTSTSRLKNYKRSCERAEFRVSGAFYISPANTLLFYN
jgi:hypothetical protein